MYKLKDKETSTFGDFLDPEIEFENHFLASREAELLKSEAVMRMEQHGATTFRLLKAVFLFAPGALYLYVGTFQILTFELFQNFYSPAIIFAIGAFMTIFGIGSLRNPKDIAIPISIVSVALCFYAICTLLGNPLAVFTYGVFLLPIVFVLPYLVRSSSFDDSDKNL